MMPSVSGLAPRFALAPAFSAARSLLSGQSVGGRGLGGVGGVLFPPRQLPLQIRDLLFRVRDLLFAFGNLPFALRNLPFALRNLPVAFSYPTAKLFVLSQQPRILPMQLFPVELIGAPMAVPFHLGLPGPADRSRTHLFHSKRFGEDCPEKSTRVPELLLVYQGGTFRYLQVPGANDSTAGAINNKGQIVGAYTTPGSQYIGYIATPVQ
jgi:hypothetical protein